MELVEQQIARYPLDLDVRAWRARVFAWSGQNRAAEVEYMELIRAGPKNPDNYIELSTIYLRENRPAEALRLLDTAVVLDASRADLRLARGHALWKLGKQSQARAEFERALTADPSHKEAYAALAAGREEARHFLRMGVDADLFNSGQANQHAQIALASQWTPRWRTSFSMAHYSRGGIGADQASSSLTLKCQNLGALTVGGSGGQHQGIIPKGEAFFDYDNGWKLQKRGSLKGLEIAYAQHWYWYTTARIVTLNQTALFYLPKDWTWSLRLSEVRSQFYGTEIEWRPTGAVKLAFPIARAERRPLRGDIFFATGTETFGEIDQIGRFASQTYGGTVGYGFTRNQDVSGFAAYQKRSGGRSQTSFGFTYGIHF